MSDKSSAPERDRLAAITSLRQQLAGGAAAIGQRWLRLGLPAKLLLVTAVFLMVAEVMIFLPSIASFRVTWLNDRLSSAYVAMLAADATPDKAVPPGVRNELLRTGLVRAIAVRRAGARRVVMPAVTELEIGAHFDLRPVPGGTLREIFFRRIEEIRDALQVFLAPEDRVIRIVGLLGPRYDDTIEVVLPEEPLRRAMVQQSLNVLWISVIISLLAAATIYFAISRLFVRPIVRLSHNMVLYAESPEDQSRFITPSERGDEIGVAERGLASMQRQLSQLLLQKNRLAEMGLAVSKISHDLRNMLAHAQLISDRLTSVPDPTVQQFAPKLIASLDRAINFCNTSLRFGRAEEAKPRRELMRLRPIAEEVADSLGLGREGAVALTIDMDDQLHVDADHEHLYRILSNLARNSVQAIESREPGGPPGRISIKAWREGRRVLIELSDNGPGLSAAARAKLFKAFQGSTRKGGAGLGLAIASELATAHGGRLTLLERTPGAAFLVEIPDRSVT